jgi:hypothetical protein
VLHICTDCHSAHAPAIRPFQPSPPPKVRSGLERAGNRNHEHLSLWQELSVERGEHR